MRKLKLSVAVLAVSALGAGCASQAEGESSEEFPSKSVRVIVAYEAGSTTDNIARAVSSCMETETGQSFLVENRPGGSAIVGTTELVNASADGYTLGLQTTSSSVLAPLTAADVSYGTEAFKPIGVAAQVPYIMYVAKDSPYESAEDVFDAAKAKSGDVVVATPGESTLPGFILGDMMQANYDIKFGQVPIDANTENLRGIKAGDYEVGFTTTANEILAAEEAGEVRFLATSLEDPPEYLADVPSFASLGYDELLPAAGQSSIYYLTATEDVPDSVVEALSDPLETCVADEKVRTQIGEPFAPADFTDGPSFRDQMDELSASLAEAIG